MNYRRLYVRGGTYFFTVCLTNRQSSLLTDHAAKFYRAYERVCAKHPFQSVALSLLPDHLHAVWTLPDGDDDFSTRWRLIKHGFTRAVGTIGIWQNRFWEHAIRDDRDLERCVTYTLYNAAKHGLIADPDDWPYSTSCEHALVSDDMVHKVGDFGEP